MKLGIFNYFAWFVTMLHSDIPEKSNYIDAWYVYEAEDLLARYRKRGYFTKTSRLLREELLIKPFIRPEIPLFTYNYEEEKS